MLTIFDIRHSDGAFCDVGGEDDLAFPGSWLVEHPGLLLPRQCGVQWYQLVSENKVKSCYMFRLLVTLILIHVIGLHLTY